MCSVSGLGGGIGLAMVWAMGLGVVCHACGKLALNSHGVLCMWLIMVCV